MMAEAGSAAETFTITLDDVEYAVVVEGGATQSPGGSPTWRVIVNGRPFTVELGDDGTVLVDGIVYDVTVDGDTVRAGDVSHTMAVSGLSLRRAPTDRLVGSAPAVEAREDAGAIVAIMPGQVTRVMVAEGDEIEDGEAVCVLEAMKMENELRADRGGVVKAVYVNPGDDVEKGQVLVEIEVG